MKTEKEETPKDVVVAPVVKSEPETNSKQGEPPKPLANTTPQFLPPRPSPAPSPVSVASPAAHSIPSRSPAHSFGRSPAHHALDDALFKSPIMSPSYPPPLSRTPNPFAMKIMSPDPRNTPHDSPGSPNKNRQRIRAVPLLTQHQLQRRSESEEDAPRIHQRVRHISTSSTTSVTKFVPQQVGRIRTESTCSAYSDVSVFKPRRGTRSDEYLRLCEARRELLKKCNGEAPDKSQLRMYDMIYYNPKSNPMKKYTEEGRQEEEEQKQKQRRMSVASSVAGPAAEPVKEETPKAEANQENQSEEPEESAMPVPQLKLGPNGEMILDETSLVIERTGERAAKEAIANAEIVYDDLNSSE